MPTLFVSHLAENAGYHSVFLGNNAYLKAVPAFSRYSSWGNTDTGTMDTIAALPALFDRYRDEPVLLVYYVSTPHAQSKTPRRLVRRLRLRRAHRYRAVSLQRIFPSPKVT